MINTVTIKNTRNRKRYLENYKELIYQYFCNEQRTFYNNHLYYFMKGEYEITCTCSTFFRYLKDHKELYKSFKCNRENNFTVRFETKLA